MVLAAVLGVVLAIVLGVFWGGQRSAIAPVSLATPSATAIRLQQVYTTAQLSQTINHTLDPQPAAQSPQFVPKPALRGKLVDGAIVPADDRVIALTFDDGPWPGTTPAILELLARYQAKATFFWVGKSLAAQPAIGAQVVAAGHAIANHTWSHEYHHFSPALATQEVDRLATAMGDVALPGLHLTSGFFRPPGGILTNGVVKAAQDKGYAIVLWSQTSADTDPRAKPEVFVKNVLRDAKPGNIVLMHDGGGDRRRTVAALPKILEGLSQRGYRFVTVPELLDRYPARYRHRPVGS